MDFFNSLKDNFSSSTITSVSLDTGKKSVSITPTISSIDISKTDYTQENNQFSPIEYPPAIIEQPLQIKGKKEKKPKSIEDTHYTLDFIREPMITFCITPTNAPELSNNGMFSPFGSPFGSNSFSDNLPSTKVTGDSSLLLNTVHGLYTNFYLPHRIRFNKSNVKLKMNDNISYKILMVGGKMKFFFSVPLKWKKSFISSIQQDWGNVDITEVDSNIVHKFEPSNSKVMDISLRQHYALSIKTVPLNNDIFFASLASLASTLDKEDNILIDFNIEPVNNSWKDKSQKKLREFKNGKPALKDDFLTLRGLLGKSWDMSYVILDEFSNLLEDVMMLKKEEEKKGKKKEDSKQLFDLKYSEEKSTPNMKGYNVQIRVIGESIDDKKIAHAFKNIENSFTLLDGDNKFGCTYIKSKKSIKKVIESVEKNLPLMGKPKDILFDKELKNLLTLPNKDTLNEYNKVIVQDNHTRSEIEDVFFDESNGSIPIGYTLDKKPKNILLGGYERQDWTEKGRLALSKQKLDDRSTATMVFGSMGSGKTSASESQALYTFGAHITDKEVWKRESKSVVLFDVADGSMIKNIYNYIQPWQRDRVIILNHSNFKNPVAVNNADLDEFNREVMQDDDYAYTLAEMEARLVIEILGANKTISVDRWFISALQCVHEVDKDWGYIEAIKLLIDTDFRNDEVMPKIKNRRLLLEIKSYNEMVNNKQANKVIETIQNRFSQLERDQKLWDCIAQKPLRGEDGKVKLNFRKMMDGDKDGAYLILIYIPKSGVSNLYRKFLFAHYFTKVWNVLLSREVGFAGREYRPETLIIVDEIHQIIDIPLIGKLFIDLFKEPRKYSGRYWFTLHGWSSLAKAGRGLDKDIKQSIMDNGCNLIMLKGGGEAFQSLSDFLHPMTIADFNNLMNMDFCGIFALRWNNKNHVMQVKLMPQIEKNPDFEQHSEVDTHFLTDYSSDYGRTRNDVREDNLNRSYDMLEKSISFGFDSDDVNITDNTSFESDFNDIDIEDDDNPWENGTNEMR